MSDEETDLSLLSMKGFKMLKNWNKNTLCTFLAWW